MIASNGAARVLHRATLVVCALALCAAGAAAQDADDAPAARVGRIAVAQGELYIAPQDRAQEWAGVGLNHPVATGDNLWMSGEGRAEVDYGGGQFRLGPDSNVHVSRLDEAELALFVAQGRVVVRVRALEPGESARIDTPNAQVLLDRAGLYRIDVSPEPRQTWVIVREGEASVMLASGPRQVLPGQTAAISGLNGEVAEVQNGVGVDALDTWSAERDRVYERGRTTTAYVSRQMVGYADLETNGSWESYPEYGAVWFPTATPVADWAPYRYGHWVWLAAYGWTWVDDAPWGYAPFHYGRWAHIGGRWGWCPGLYVARPVWAPALVAWYGGSGWSVSTQIGAPVFGWVPLGWRDPFIPWWGGCSNRCYTRYNRPYAVDVRVRPQRPPAVYVNARVPGAATAVPAAALRDTRPVQASRVTVPVQGFASAPVLAAAPDVRPTRVSNQVVQPGRGAPQPAGEIAARVKPQALSPFGGMQAAPARASGTTRSGSAVTAVPPASRVPGNATRGAPPSNAVPPAAGNGVPPAAAIEPRRAPAAGDLRRTEPARAAQPQNAPAMRPAPTERVMRTPPSPQPAPAPPARVGPQAPVTSVPPARVGPPPVTSVAPARAAPHAAPAPAPSPAPREAPQRPGPPPQAERPGGPRQQQN